MPTNLTNANPEKTTSAARLAANQANALKSTGPKTEAGRTASKMNALKHGIFSSEILVRGRHIQENPEELATLHQRMLDAYHPVGVAEEMLVDQLVTLFWRTRRLQKAEAGEIALSVDNRVEQLQPPNRQHLQQQWQNSENIELAMAQSLEGNRLMEDQLNAVRRCVVKQGELNSQAIAFVQLDGEPYELTGTLEILLEDLQKNPQKLGTHALRVWQKEQVLVFLDGQLAEIGERIKILNEREIAAHEAQKAAALMPAREVLDRLGLYETRLRRQFNITLTQLERMQRARRSQDASPVSSLEGIVPENTETKKRTQSPSVNDPIATAQCEAVPAPTARFNPSPGHRPGFPPDRESALKGRPNKPSPSIQVDLAISPKDMGILQLRPSPKADPQNMPNEKTNPIANASGSG
jgi:hypothetical protein